MKEAEFPQSLSQTKRFPQPAGLAHPLPKSTLSGSLRTAIQTTGNQYSPSSKGRLKEQTQGDPMKLKTLAVLAAILPALAIAAPARPSSGRASQSKPAQSKPQERASSGRNSSSKQQDNKPQRGRNSQNRDQDNKPANGRTHSRQQQETKPGNSRTNARQQQDTRHNAAQPQTRSNRSNRQPGNEPPAQPPRVHTQARPQPQPEPQDNSTQQDHSPQNNAQTAEHSAAKAQCLRYVVDGNNLSAFAQDCRPDAATAERYQAAFKNTQAQFERDNCLDIVGEDEAQAALNLELNRLGQTSRLFCPAVKDELPGIAHRYRNVK
ncbi:hypothetical protein A7Q00_02035 [Eikenella halliae]|uniref:Uncharacterized protein n=2 Tax=Eikenella halliae TaxID=1795832 RepID=A0A1B6W1S6_9NEIS|nr:hypothetical protein A7Q00_02035 [Eikenella halliae]